LAKRPSTPLTRQMLVKNSNFAAAAIEAAVAAAAAAGVE
jgi:hypothetical protein